MPTSRGVLGRVCRSSTAPAPRTQKRHPYAVIHHLESLLRDAMALQTLGDPRGGTPQNLAEIESLAEQPEEVKGGAFNTWGHQLAHGIHAG